MEIKTNKTLVFDSSFKPKNQPDSITEMWRKWRISKHAHILTEAEIAKIVYDYGNPPDQLNYD